MLCNYNSLGAQSASHLGFTTLLSTFLGSVGLLGFFEAWVLWGPMGRKVTPWDETPEAASPVHILMRLARSIS